MANYLQFKPNELKNYIINGDFSYWQRGSSFTISSSSPYTADRTHSYSITAGSGSATVTPSTDVPTDSSATTSLKWTQAVAATFAGGTYVIPYEQKVEGVFAKHLYKKMVTMSFWIKASVAGQYSLSLSDSVNSLSYVAPYQVPTANTWTYISKTIKLPDTGGTWNTDTSVGLRLIIGANSGINFMAPTTNTWTNGNYHCAASDVVYTSTVGATLQLSEVTLNLGSNPAPFSYFAGNYADELGACQRYFEKSYPIAIAPGAASALQGLATATADATAVNLSFGTQRFMTLKRISPSVTLYNPISGSTGTAYNSNTGTSVAAAPGYTGSTGTGITMSASTAAGQTMIVHWTADAEY